jgi:hypothetical protein
MRRLPTRTLHFAGPVIPILTSARTRCRRPFIPPSAGLGAFRLVLVCRPTIRKLGAGRVLREATRCMEAPGEMKKAPSTWPPRA